MTISEGLTWLKTLQERHTELVGLRNDNGYNRITFRGLKGDTPDKTEPVYDVVHLDGLISKIARERRKLDAAIKATNAKAEIEG